MAAWPIEMGRTRKSGTKKALAARDAAYAGNVQVVSYDLASHVDETGWDAIIFDEIHHLSDCTSKQSRTAQRLMRNNPGVPCIGLSATLIPTELWQLWHPMHLLFGSKWGRAPKAGKIAWDFVGRYCHVERNEYGCAPGVPRESRQAELKKRLDAAAHRLNREDIADDLPPLDVSILDVPGDSLARGLQVVGKAPLVRPELSFAVDWFKSLEADVHHVVLLAYHRDVARGIADAIAGITGEFPLYIDGSMPTGERVNILALAETMPKAVLVATSESMREGVRAMWAQKVLLVEWRQSPVKVIQTLGRFYSVGDRRRPQIQVLTDESLYGAARKLVGRMSAYNKLIKAGNTEETVEAIFAPAEMSEAKLEERTRQMLADGPRGQDCEWSEEQEEADEW